MLLRMGRAMVALYCASFAQVTKHRVDGITPNAITIGRGCLDTVPRRHASGTPILFFDEGARITEEAWAAGETLAVRLLPETGRGTLAFALRRVPFFWLTWPATWAVWEGDSQWSLHAHLRALVLAR